MYLLDTNIVSEMRKYHNQTIDPNVAAWLKNIAPEQTFLSAISIMELRVGVLSKLRKDPKQGEALQHWYEHYVLPTYSGRILSVTPHIAAHCAELHIPNRRPFSDSYLAATALVHNFTLVTRNVKDFQGLKLRLINPFESQ